MWPKWLWEVLITVILLEAGLSKGCLEKERIGLLQLNSFFNLVPFPHNWVKEEDSDCCQWERAECDNTTRRVITLDLSNMRSGSRYRLKSSSLNASLFLPFEELRSLYLSGNQITDFTRPSRMSSLETLDLSYNYLNNGSLPNLLGLSSLRDLDLSENELKGTLNIGSFSNLINLQDLALWGNEIESLEYSQDVGRQVRLINLEELDLSYNLFNSTIFAQLRGFPNLNSLYVGSNQFNGLLDIKELSALSNLELLYMYDTEINELVTGEASGGRRLSKLRVLSLVGCFTQRGNSVSLELLVEAFPSIKTLFLGSNEFLNRTLTSKDMHLLSNVEELFLDNATLDINFLQSMTVLTSLKSLSLYNCSLTGTLPKGLCHLKSLEELNLKHNDLSGAIVSCLGNMTSLRLLDISGNHFTGNVASTPLVNLTSLQTLLISHNHFQVPLSFSSFANHSKLKILLISGNELLSEPTLQRSPQFQLKIFSMSYCTIKERTKELPNFLRFQNDLRYVDISGVNFGGITFPCWLIENNTRLQKLYMMNSFIVGPLLLPRHPHFNLSTIDISNNKIGGYIPTDICSCFPNLIELFLSGDAFDGNIPSCFGGMSSLSILDLSFNKLFGEIPIELALSGSVEILQLSNNNLSGRIPPAIFSSQIREGVHLGSNNFDGEIPYISTNTSVLLIGLNLSDNRLSGEIPRWLWNMPRVKILALTRNNLEGLIPRELCKYLYSLEVLDLSENKLSGSIPFPSCFSPPLRHVHLSHNRLSGLMPLAYTEISSLVTLDLGQNKITGEIPYWIGRLSTLSVLLLNANQLNGEIPTQLCQLNSLSIVNLSKNKLSGSIPSCLGSLTLESRPDKSQGSLGGSLGSDLLFGKVFEDYYWYSMDDEERHTYPTDYVEERIAFSTKRSSYIYKSQILKFFSGIDLSCNKFTGEIPPEVGNMAEIRSLNLSWNNLSGSIPSTFSRLEQIESLDLSHNNFNGKIPPQLTDLNTLEVFTVAYNNLSGPLPDMKAQFGTFDQSSYEGNPSLCGPPLENSCTKDDSSKIPSPSSNEEEEEEEGYIDRGIFCISFGVSYAVLLLAIALVLYINPYWRRAWFYFVEQVSTACYYFIVDNLHGLPCFR